MWHEDVQDFGKEIELDSTFRFECHPELSCFGMCCGTEITLTTYDVARMRRHMSIDTGAFLSEYCKTFIDPRTGFPFVILSMLFEAMFNFDRFFEKYGRFPHTSMPKDDHQMIVLVRSIALNLIKRTAQLN